MLRNAKLCPLSLIALLALTLLALGAISLSADSGSATYKWLTGVAPVIGPDVAGTPDGATITMTGSGTLSIHPKSVTGGGDFTHRDANGNVLGSGTWTATKLLSFNSYGSFAAPAPPTFEGGQALFRIHLSPSAGGPGFDGVLKVSCLGGSPPPGKDEGVQLAVQGGPNFNRNFGEFEGGQTLFIRQ